MPKRIVLLTACFGLLVALNMSLKKGETMSRFILESSAFKHNQEIPAPYTCQGADSSPDLGWHGEPADTKSFALICSDPDAPHGTFIHWVAYDIPAQVHELAAGIQDGDTLENGAKHGINSFGKLGYGGPCPPSGTHHYHFDLFALDTVLNKPAGLTEQQLRTAIDGHILAQTRLTGLYKKK